MEDFLRDQKLKSVCKDDQLMTVVMTIFATHQYLLLVFYLFSVRYVVR